MIVAPVEPRSKAYHNDCERRKKAYQARKEAGLCQRCNQPGRIKRNGQRAVYCEAHLAGSRAYQTLVRTEGTEAQRVVRGVGA